MYWSTWTCTSESSLVFYESAYMYCIKDGVICDCGLLWCDGAANGDGLVIELTTIAVRPTHYSLPYGDCGGMMNWNFEASVDGNNWETLHKARNDLHLTFPPKKWDAIEKRIDKFERDYIEEKKCGQKMTHEQFLARKINIFTGYAEETGGNPTAYLGDE